VRLLKTKSVFVLCAVLALTALSATQAVPAYQGNIVDAVGLPGQTWTSVGNLSPIEHNNVYAQSYIEQSAALFATPSGSMTVTPYVSLGLVFDTQRYAWNNKVEPRAGFKFNKFFHSGVVSLGSAYCYEDRFQSIQSSGLIVYVQDWFGWQAASEKLSRFPGSSWAAVGNISPVERGNVIGEGYVSQGVIAKRIGATALVPYADFTFSRDTKGFDWDNKALWGSGLKAIIPHGGLYTEVGVAYLHEHRFQTDQSAGGLTLFTNFSFGWNLLSRGAGR
jgi:hypothetical protein